VKTTVWCADHRCTAAPAVRPKLPACGERASSTMRIAERGLPSVLATTTESDDGRPKKPGAINGGFFPKRPDWPAQHPSVVIAVDDIQAAMKNVAEAGGKVLGEPLEIPGVGQYVSFYDTEGNRVSMLQPLPRN
jgi:hypothetical protein